RAYSAKKTLAGKVRVLTNNAVNFAAVPMADHIEHRPPRDRVADRFFADVVIALKCRCKSLCLTARKPYYDVDIARRPDLSVNTRGVRAGDHIFDLEFVDPSHEIK